jgi:tetratricopeptide (TPR) repeat protein
MLTDDDRRLGHRLAGEWLDGRAAFVDPAVLALHFELGGVRERAARAYRRAAEHALEGGDLAAATQFAERGLAHSRDGENGAAMDLTLARADGYRGDHRARVFHASESERRAPPGGSLAWSALREQIAGLGILAETPRLRTAAKQLLALAIAPGAARAWIDAAAMGSVHLLYHGDDDLAAALVDRMLETAAPLRDSDVGVSARIHQVLAARSTSDAPVESLKHRALSADCFARIGDTRAACQQRVNLGFMQCELGQFEAAETTLRAALAAAERMGLDVVRSAALHNLGYALRGLSRWAEAERAELRAIAAFAAQGDRRGEGLSRAILASILIASRELADAEREARAAVAALESSPAGRALGLAVLADVLLEQGRIQEALKVAGEADRLLEVAGRVIEQESLLRVVIADAHWASGSASTARDMVRRACARLREKARVIDDAEVLESFLRRVPENRRLLEREIEFGVVAPAV